MKKAAYCILVLPAASCIAVLAMGTLLLVVLLGPANEGAQASGGTGADPQIIGFDMDPANTPANAATSLGSIENCIAVTHPSTFDIDVFLDDVPNGMDLAGFIYDLNYDPSYLNVTACRTSGTYLLGSTAASNMINPGDLCPHSDGSLAVVASDTNMHAGEPAASLGVLERYTLATQQAGPHVVGLTLTYIAVADSQANGWWAVDGDQLWDAAFTPQYGLVAIDAPCPSVPVGGIAELPNVSDSSSRNYIALAGLAAAALLSLTAGGWYASRRWLR